MRTYKSIYTTLIALAIPLILQRLVSSIFSSIDIWMVGQLGQTAMSGISIGGQWLWILNRILAGVSAGGLLFITQYSGMGKDNAIFAVFKMMLKIMVISAAFFAFIGMVFPQYAVGIFEGSDETMKIAKEYLAISSISFILLAVANACTTFLIAIGNGKYAMISVAVNAFVHIIMNWIFIFKMHMPSGKGAAWAAVTAALAGLLTALPFTLKEFGRISGTNETFEIDKKKFGKVSFALILHETVWGMGIFVYNVIFSHIDASGYCAVVIWRTINDFFFSVICAFASAGGIMLGNFVGEGVYSKVVNWAKKIQLINSSISLGLGIILFVGAPSIVRLFNLFSGMEENVIIIAVFIVRLFATEIVLKSIAHTFVESIFRAGGNPEMGLIMDTVATWVVVIPLCCVAAFVTKSGFLPVFLIMLFGEDIVKILISAIYFRTGKWYRRIESE